MMLVETGVMKLQATGMPEAAMHHQKLQRQGLILSQSLKREHGPTNTLISDLQPLEVQENRFCCLSHLDCGTQLWQLEEMNRACISNYTGVQAHQRQIFRTPQNTCSNRGQDFIDKVEHAKVRTRASKTGVLYCEEIYSLLVFSASFYYRLFLLVQKNILLNFLEILLIRNNKKSKLKYQRMINNDHY